MVFLPVRLLQGALVISVFLHIYRNVGPSGSEYEYGAGPIPLFSKVLDLIREKSLRVCPLMQEPHRPRDSLQILPTIQAHHASGFPLPDRCLHFNLRFQFFKIPTTGLPVLDCLFADFV